jgi:hypothetical protein
VAPRNGHVSAFAARTFATLAERTGMIFHRGVGHSHVLRTSERPAGLATRVGPVMTYVRLRAPGRWPAKGFSGVEGAAGQQFQWTAETVIDWIIDVPKSRPRVEVMIPFAHESRGGFAAGCVIEVNEKKVVTTVRERSVCAETEPLAAGRALVTLRTEPLTTAHDRSIGLALKV